VLTEDMEELYFCTYVDKKVKLRL